MPLPVDWTPTLTWADCTNYIEEQGVLEEPWYKYRDRVRPPQRLGQAWFNALPADDQSLLVMTDADPYYVPDGVDAIKHIVYALEYLLTN